MRKGRTPKAAIAVSVRMHRPVLTPAQEAIASQYRPPEACPCGKDGREWLMETPIDGKDLEYYCLGCGKYRIVPRTLGLAANA
jgi:hypothetical protein